MANLKEIKNRIGSVQKTKQITSAMKLVAGAKLRKATERAVAARPYQEKLAEVLARVADKAGESFSDPLLEQRDEVKKVLVVVLTTDRGLCGSFNSTLLRHTHDWLTDKRDAGLDVTLHVYGRKGRDFFKARGWDVDDATINYGKTEAMDLVRPLSQQMVGGFADGDHDEVWLVYNQFVNTMTQTPHFGQVVPIAIPETEGETSLIEHRYEPDAQELLSRLLPLYLRTVVLQAFLETDAGEQAARMTAMDNATRNASELIDSLSLEYNRARQAAITTEITEIVSGAEAL